MGTQFTFKELTNAEKMDVSAFSVVGVQVVGGAGTVEGSNDGATWVAATITNNVISPCGWRFLRLNGAGTAHLMGK